MKVDKLSRTEIKIAMLAAGSRTNKQIAEIHGVKESSIKWHLTNIYKKLGIERRGQLIILMAKSHFAEAKPSETKDGYKTLPCLPRKAE